MGDEALSVNRPFLFDETIVVDGATYTLFIFEDWSFYLPNPYNDYITGFLRDGEVRWHTCPPPIAVKNYVEDLVLRLWKMRLFL
jgi:hypothetical protein